MMLFFLFIKITQPLWEKYTKEVIEQHERELKEYKATQESDPISSIPSTYKPNQNTTSTNISPPEKAISKEFVNHDSDDSGDSYDFAAIKNEKAKNETIKRQKRSGRRQ